MGRLTRDSVQRANLAPGSEEYDVSQLGGSVAIEGIATADELDKIYGEIDEVGKVASGAGTSIPGVGQVRGNQMTIISAVWAAHCVKDPVFSSLEWIAMAQTPAGYSALQSIGTRCLIMSRIAPDPAAPATGVDAAAEELVDPSGPFEPSGIDSRSDGSGVSRKD